MEIQTKLYAHKDKENKEVKTLILQINVAQEQAEIAEAGLCKVLVRGVPSPVGQKKSSQYKTAPKMEKTVYGKH